MSDTSIREKVIDTANKYIGAKEGGKKHKELIDAFNTVKPDGGTMTTSAPWCAAFVSAIEIIALGKATAKKICPLSYNCGTIIERAKKKNEWIENDAYTPELGDWVLYDWQDSGKGDNHGGADHVGLVEKITKKQITVIEGNKNDRVERRTLKLNGRYIRGYVAIPYEDVATKPKAEKKKKAVAVGATVMIRKGANIYGTTKRFAAFVYDRKYKVVEIHGNRVVVGDGKAIIGAVRKADCIVQ